MTDGDLYGTITKCGSTALHARYQPNRGHPRDGFANFRKLKRSSRESVSITALGGSVLSDAISQPSSPDGQSTSAHCLTDRLP